MFSIVNIIFSYNGTKLFMKKAMKAFLAAPLSGTSRPFRGLDEIFGLMVCG
jgi:hypothetical protein